MSLGRAEARFVSDDQPLTKQLFRQVMGRFATGVTVVTTIESNEVYGMTANAFMAGSLEPMLCVISINRAAQMHERLLRAGHFGVSFLSEWQQHLSSHFAGRRFDCAAPEFVFRGTTPILARSVAALTATTVGTTQCGDHTLFVGQISHMETAVGRPLLFYGGRYGRIELQNPIEESEPPEFW
jgi:flavin reductase (DIM6/NTAB) family NADH-FMN oxidoreductase RutF